MKRIEIQWRSKAKGAWKWARTRGFFRVVLADPELGCTTTLNGNGLLRVLHQGPDCTADYPGGRYGWLDQVYKARSYALAATRGHFSQLPVVDIGWAGDGQQAELIRQHNGAMLGHAVAVALASQEAERQQHELYAWAYDATAEERGLI